MGKTLPTYVGNSILSGHKVWGVTFDGTNVTGTRLYDASGLIWTPSSTAGAGLDDFIAVNDGNSPFHIRKCIMQYDSTTKTTTYTFKDTDPTTYATLLTNKTGARMVAFPKFYYKRPDLWTFLVSNDPIDGFLPSPMHYKRPSVGVDKVLSDYVYVSEFMYNGNASQPGTPTGNLTVDQHRVKAASFGMRVMDIETKMMINILCAIKYNTLNAQYAIGNGVSNSTGQAESDWANCEFDGYKASKTDYTGIKMMGLIDWFGNGWTMVDNAFTTSNYIYINDSKIIDYNDVYNTAAGWTKTNISVNAGNATFNSLSNDPSYPFILAPAGTDSAGITGDAKWANSGEKNVIMFGGFPDPDPTREGMFAWGSAYGFTTTSATFCARYMV